MAEQQDTFVQVKDKFERFRNELWKPILLGLLIILPFFLTMVTGNTYGVTLLTELLVFAIAAVSYDLLFGYTGLLSFGHALYFGGGAYFVAIISTHTALNYIGAIPVALIAVPVLALITGAIALRLSGVYFAIITLAIAQLGHEIILQFPGMTGGVNGISSIALPVIAGFNLSNLYVTYYLLFIVLISTYIFLQRLVHSPFGRVLQGIRENPDRMRMLGINVYRYRLASFTIAGFIAGIAGLLYPLYLNFVDPSLVNWTTTGDILIMTLIGGFGSLWGGILGAAFYVIIKGVLSTFTDQWRILLGLIFVAVVLFFPTGIAGILRGDQRTVSDIIQQWREQDAQSLQGNPDNQPTKEDDQQ